MMMILVFVVVEARPMMTSYPSSFPECHCSNEGAVSAACDRLTGQCFASAAGFVRSHVTSNFTAANASE